MNKYWSFFGWLIGISVSIYLYFITVNERKPTFIIDPLKPKIISGDYIKNSPIHITDSLGNEIHTDVRIITFYFFNQGKHPIKKSDILEQLKIKVFDGEILDQEILRISRKNINKITLTRSASDKATLHLDFNILEQNDGFKGQILVASNNEPRIQIEGTIEGVNNFLDSYVDIKRFIYPISIIILMIGFFIGIMYLLVKHDSRGISLKARLITKYKLIIVSSNNLAEKTTVEFSYLRLLIVTASFTFFVLTMSFLIVKNNFDLIEKNKTQVEVPISYK